MELDKMKEDFEQLAGAEPSPSVESKVFGIPLLMDRILKDVKTNDILTLRTKELLALRSVSKAWNANVLRLLQKRDHPTINLTLTNLMENDPCCFRNKDSKILLRHVILKLNCEEEWKVRLQLQRFLELHHEHILHLTATTPDFFRDIWNKWKLPKLETLVMSQCYWYCHYGIRTPIPPYIAEKASVTKLLLCQNENTLAEPLMAATPRLQELDIWSNDTNTTLSRLTTTNLKVLSASLRTPNGPEIMNAFLRSHHSQGLEKLQIYFDYYPFFPSCELVFETPMPKLKELVLADTDIVLKNLGPGLFPQLESLSLCLEILDEDSLRGRFEKLRELGTTVVDVSEVRKLVKLLSMCETAEVVKVYVPWPGLPAGHLFAVNKILLNSLTYFGKLKKLKMYIGFDLDADEEGVVTCSNLDDIEWQMMKLKSLADKGLKRLCLVVTRQMKRGESPWPPCYTGDWGQSFCCGLISLAKIMKRIRIRGYGCAVEPLFIPALGERMRQAIQEDKLPLEVSWDDDWFSDDEF